MNFNHILGKIKYERLVFLLLLAILTFTTLYSIPAADNWWNLATGRYISENFKIPSEDVFSYTAEGKPWIVTQWLFQVFLYLLYSISGIKGIYLLRTGLLLLTLSFIYYNCIERKINPLISAIVLIVSAFLAQPYYYFDIRAYLISYLFIAVYFFFLERRRVKNKAFSIFLFPLINSLWVNCHSAFFLGFFLIFAYFVDEYFFIEGGKKSSLFLIKTGVLTFLSSLLNPYTYKILIYPFRLGFGSGFWQQFLNEWNPPDLFGINLSFSIFFSIIILILVITIKKISLRDLLILIAFSYLSFKAVRHITLFCIVIVPVLAKHLELLIAERKKTDIAERIKKFTEHHNYFKLIILLICLSLFLRTFFVIFTVDLSMKKEMFPFYSVQFIKENKLSGRLYNPYEWGGYLIWTLFPEKQVFCDGRAETVYSEDICKDSYFTSRGEDLSSLEKYDINFVICNKINEELGMALPAELQKLPDKWILIYTDENSYIFIKNADLNSRVLNKFFLGKLKIPDSPVANYYQASILLEKNNLKGSLSFLDRALDLDENLPECWMMKGYIMAVTGNMKEGEKCFLKLIDLYPDYPAAHYNLGLIYKSVGQLKSAEREFEEELKIHSYPPAEKELLLLEQN